TRIYVIGGVITALPGVSNKVYYAPVNGDGSLGAWITNTTTLPAALEFASGVVNKGFIYVIGGIRSDGSYRTEGYDAPINPDGSVGAWNTTSALPQTLALSSAILYNGAVNDTIFVIGGATNAFTNTNKVYFADVLGGGGLSVWSTSVGGDLPDAFSSHA